MDNLLEKYLEKKQITKAQFARILGTTPTCVNNWVSKRICPQMTMAKKIERCTKKEVPIQYFGFERDTSGKVFRTRRFGEPRKTKKTVQ